MFTGKRLPKMVPPGVTFGEHCVNLQFFLQLSEAVNRIKHN